MKKCLIALYKSYTCTNIIITRGFFDRTMSGEFITCTIKNPPMKLQSYIMRKGKLEYSCKGASHYYLWK